VFQMAMRVHAALASAGITGIAMAVCQQAGAPVSRRSCRMGPRTMPALNLPGWFGKGNDPQDPASGRMG
jgi:hypothetical protein